MIKRKIKFYHKNTGRWRDASRAQYFYWYWSKNYRFYDELVISKKQTYNFKLNNAPTHIQIFDVEPESYVKFEDTKMHEWIAANCRDLVLLRTNMYSGYAYSWIRFVDPMDVILFKTSFTDYEEMTSTENKRLLQTG